MTEGKKTLVWFYLSSERWVLHDKGIVSYVTIDIRLNNSEQNIIIVIFPYFVTDYLFDFTVSLVTKPHRQAEKEM